MTAPISNGPATTRLHHYAGHYSGTKLSQHARLGGPPGTKLSQQAPKRRFRPTFRMHGELCTASATNTTSREKKVTHQHPTSASQHPTSAQQRAALQISHAIRLRELSTKPRNVAIPTIRIQSLKYPKGNCMRNYRADGAGRGARPRSRRAATGASQAKLAHNFPRSLLETAHKRRNCNDVNSRFEVVPGELRAKLLDEGGAQTKVACNSKTQVT